jgi:DNA adenine methylase
MNNRARRRAARAGLRTAYPSVSEPGRSVARSSPIAGPSEPDRLTLRYPTPLRYPGGKQRLGAFLSRLLTLNNLIGSRYLEPFAGGAGAALYLLRSGVVSSVCLNDLDRAVYAFWFAATRRNSALVRLIERTPVTVAEWYRQKDVQRHKVNAPLLELGFSTLFFNRTNRSGILRAGMVGGRAQRGKWKLDARFHRATIAHRVAALRPYASRISVTCMDATAFLATAGRSRKATFAYLDPPYFVQGRDLYLNRYTVEDHCALAEFVKARLGCSWVLTYDDVPTIRRLYRGHRRWSYRLGYSADARREGREVMVTSMGLKVPRLPQSPLGESV